MSEMWHVISTERIKSLAGFYRLAVYLGNPPERSHMNVLVAL